MNFGQDASKSAPGLENSTEPAISKLMQEKIELDTLEKLLDAKESELATRKKILQLEQNEFEQRKLDAFNRKRPFVRIQYQPLESNTNDSTDINEDPMQNPWIRYQEIPQEYSDISQISEVYAESPQYDYSSQRKYPRYDYSSHTKKKTNYRVRSCANFVSTFENNIIKCNDASIVQGYRDYEKIIFCTDNAEEIIWTIYKYLESSLQKDNPSVQQLMSLAYQCIRGFQHMHRFVKNECIQNFVNRCSFFDESLSPDCIPLFQLTACMIVKKIYDSVKVWPPEKQSLTRDLRLLYNFRHVLISNLIK